MSSRSNILKRIRTALEQTAAHPEHPSSAPLFKSIPSIELVQRFSSELVKLKAEFLKAGTWDDARQQLKSLIDRHELRRIAISPDSDVVQLAQNLQTQSNLSGKDLADIDLGITGCDNLVARTGSVILTTRSGYGRALSVLPPAHLVVARRSQLIPDLDDAYQLLKERYDTSWPSMMTIITGPSRTADIEKILVLGAHGPKKLFVLLLDF
jgi:L-lactate dehydrogenase complex protein LldG